jgi:YD repeat-containing protein
MSTASHANAGKLMSVTNAAGKKMYFKYNNRGEPIQKLGRHDLSGEFVYNSYGEKTELHTFRGSQNWTASIWPTATTGVADITTWTYQESTGRLTQKQDAAAKGPVYTYDELGRMKTRVGSWNHLYL